MAKAPSILDDNYPDTPTCDQLGQLIDAIGIRHLCVALAVVSRIKAAERENDEPMLDLEWEQWALR